MALPNPVVVVPGITASDLHDGYAVSPEAVWSTLLNKNYDRILLHPDDLRYELQEPARVVAARREHRGDLGLAGAGAHDVRRRRARAEHHRERVDEDRLPRPRLPRQSIKPLPQLPAQLLHHRQILNP